jgi:hypothetical protein
VSKIILSSKANARHLILEIEGEASVSVFISKENGHQTIVLEADSPETSSSLGLALVGWLSRTSWDRTGGFAGEKLAKASRKRRKGE